MALKLQQPGVQPLGQFDGYDGEYLSLKGGEVVRFDQISKDPAVDMAASDVFDGYVSNATNLRTVVRLLDVDDGYMGMLADEGTSGYGTLFGVVVGGVSGQVTNGTVLGPHTATASGKVTCWDKPGLYAVSLDATEVAPTDAGLYVGAPLIVRLDNADGTQGQLAFVNVGGPTSYSTTKFGAFVAFETNGSLVTTPKSLVSPLDAAKSVMVFQFDPWGH